MPFIPGARVPSAARSTPKMLARRFLSGSALSLICAFPAAAQNVAAAAPAEPERVLIEGQRPDGYRIVAPALSKLTEPLLDTPQSIDVVPQQVLQDRAVTNLNDALRNVPGISLGAGEFSWQGNNPTIRGFLARNDMFLDGLRDFGSYSRDPFNLQQIEVLEGPASVLFGRGSTGGVINQASKMPTLSGFVDGAITGGTDMTRRATVDIDEPLPDLGPGAAFRFNAMVHAQSVAGRNAAQQNRFGLAPSLALGIGTPTRLSLSYFDQTANDVPDYGVPWFGTVPAPVPRQNFYGVKSDSLKTGTDVGTFKVEHDLTADIMLRNTVRYANYTRDFRLREPIISAPVGTPLSNVNVGFNIWSGKSTETMAWDQAEAQSHFDTGPIHHTLVTGIEGGRESSAPEFDNSSGVPTVPLLNPNPDRPFIAASTFPRLIANTIAWSFAAYALDTVKLGEQWEISAGLRWDYFGSHYRAVRYSTTTPGAITGNDDVTRIDKVPSYRGALVYKPVTNGSIYFDYGTSFNPSAETLSQITSGRGLGIANADLAPERNQTFEFGSKWDVLDERVSLTGAVFRLEKENARVPDPNNAGFNMLAGTQRVDGFDVGVQGRITDDWQITAGYTYLDGEVTKSAAGAAPVGSPLANTPKNSLSFFSEYRLGGGFEIGAGGQYVSSRLAQNTAPLRAVPGYWTFDAMAKYDLSETLSLQLNVNNIFDKYYYDAIHPFHVVPGAGRTALLTLNFRY
ncbi:MAG TPA: TonB-dependent siderophore receptor [Micropepsaceae bacterium]|nr:TonB-dependent siderophore receptor [Micropepsaceae bacterium]